MARVRLEVEPTNSGILQAIRQASRLPPAKLTFGPSLGTTTWDGAEAINHCTVSWPHIGSLGALFLLRYPATRETPESRSYRIDLIAPINGISIYAATDRAFLTQQLEDLLNNRAAND